MKLTDIYIEQVLCDDVTINLEKKEIEDRLHNIEEYVNEKFLSLDVINLIARSGIEAVDITSLTMLVSAISSPIPIRKLHLIAISDALKMATHYSFAECSESEYTDLISHIAGDIVDYSVLTGNENKYSTGQKIGLSVVKKGVGKVLNPMIKPLKAPANILMMKWILAGIHQALARYLINRYIFSRNHSIAVSEACKGYEEVLSKRFKDKLGLIFGTFS